MELDLNYVDDLKDRMRAAGITGQMLADQLGHRDASQVSRWLTENKNRRVTPSLRSLDAIEKAIKVLSRKAGKSK